MYITLKRIAQTNLGSDVGDGGILSVGHVLLEIFDGSHQEGNSFVQDILQSLLGEGAETQNHADDRRPLQHRVHVLQLSANEIGRMNYS